MSVNSQKRPILSDATQQAAATALASLVSQQFAADTYTTAFTLDVNIDRFPVDTTTGAVVATVPLATDLIKGKPYIVERVAGTSDVTLTLSGADEFEGETTISITETGIPFVFVSDGTTLRRAGPGALPGLPSDPVIARTDLGVNKEYLPLRVATLVGSNVYRIWSPYAGLITKIISITEGVLTTGDATLTGKIGGVAITTGVITITQVGSAAGDKDTTVPTAANTVAVGDEVSLTVGGTNATATVANCWIEITRT